MNIITARYYFNMRNGDVGAKFIFHPECIVRETPKCYYTEHGFRYRKADINVVKFHGHNNQLSHLEVVVIDKSDEEISKIFTNWFERNKIAVSAGETI